MVTTAFEQLQVVDWRPTPVVVWVESNEHECTFVSVGSHDHPAFADFHGSKPCVLVEWIGDEAILARGLRSWVCGDYVEACHRNGIGDFVLV